MWGLNMVKNKHFEMIAAGAMLTDRHFGDKLGYACFLRVLRTQEIRLRICLFVCILGIGLSKCP